MKRSSTLVAAAAATLLGAVAAHAAVTVGQAAPDFKVKDTAGKEQSLSAYKGKFVVLEWVNPDCPFVKKHYETSNMQATQKAAEAKGVVWLSVSTSGDDAGGARGSDLNAWAKKSGATPTATLLDDGKVGKAYGARTTPHIYIVDPAGKVVYAGAIDSKPTAKHDDVKGATNYVTAALNEATAGKPVTKATSEPYGCSVKY
jgi:peroxiredoxin